MHKNPVVRTAAAAHGANRIQELKNERLKLLQNHISILIHEANRRRFGVRTNAHSSLVWFDFVKLY